MSGGEEWGLALSVCSIYCGAKSRYKSLTSKEANGGVRIQLDTDDDIIETKTSDSSQDDSETPDDSQGKADTSSSSKNIEFMKCISECTATIGGIL